MNTFNISLFTILIVLIGCKPLEVPISPNDEVTMSTEINDDVATPAEIDGKMEDGKIIAINGAHFPNKPIAQPFYWNDFEKNSVPEVDRSNYGMFKGLPDTQKTAPGSQVSHRFDISKQSVNNSDVFVFGETPQLYLYKKIYYDFALDDLDNHGSMGLNLKVLRLWTGDYKNNMYLGYQGKEGADGNPRTVAEYTGESTVWGKVPYSPFKWQQNEMLYQEGTIGQKNSQFKFVRDGQMLMDSLFTTRTEALSGRYTMLNFDQISNGTGAGPMNIYYDDLYIDTTWARVMIADAPTLAASQVLEIQIPITWKNNRIEIQLRKGAFATFSGKYLIIVDQNNKEHTVIKL